MEEALHILERVLSRKRACLNSIVWHWKFSVTLFDFIYVQTKHVLTHFVGATYILPSGNSLFIIKYHIHEVINFVEPLWVSHFSRLHNVRQKRVSGQKRRLSDLKMTERKKPVYRAFIKWLAKTNPLALLLVGKIRVNRSNQSKKSCNFFNQSGTRPTSILTWLAWRVFPRFSTPPGMFLLWVLTGLLIVIDTNHE